VLDLIHDGHFATASKDRTGLFNSEPQPVNEDTGRALLAWLDDGALVASAPNPADAPPAAAPGMAPEVIADWLAYINDASDIDALKARTGEARAAAQDVKDRDAYAAFNAAYRKQAATMETAA
jgi:hypothetical protein